MGARYPISVIWSSHGEQLRADLEATARGLGTVERRMNTGQRQMGLWGQQIRAIGTTLRYAFAGGIVYSVASAISSLSDFEAKLGETAATATNIAQDGSVQHIGQSISDLGDMVLRASTDLVTPVEQVQATMREFYSSFEPPPGKRGLAQVQTYLDAVTKGARVGEVSGTAEQQQYSAGVITLANSLLRGRQDLPLATDIISKIVQRGVGFRGGNLGMNITRLAQSAAQGGFSAQEMAGLTITASKSGANPMLTTRGLSSMMESLLHPITDTQKAAYRSIGLPTDPNALAQLRSMNVLYRLMKAVGPLSLNRAGRFMTEEGAMNLPETGASAQQIGIQGTGNRKLLFDLFSKTYAARAFVQLLSKGTDTIDKFTKEAGNVKGTTVAMFGAFKDQAALMQAQQAWKTFGIQFARNFDPVLHSLAAGVTWASRFSQGHRNLTTGIAIGTAGSVLGARILSGMRARGILNRLPGRAGRILGTAGAIGEAGIVGGMMAEAAPAILAGVGNGTRAAPLWVIIHPVTWNMPGAPTGLMGGGGGGTPIIGGGRGSGRFTGRLGGFLRGAGGAGAAVGMAGADALALGAVGAAILGGGELLQQYRGNTRNNSPAEIRRQIRDRTSSISRFRASQVAPDNLPIWFTNPNWQGNRDDRFERIQQMAGARAGGFGGAEVELRGKAETTIHIDASDEAKRLLKMDRDRKVPVKLWTVSSRGKRPTSRGKPIPPGRAGGLQ